MSDSEVIYPTSKNGIYQIYCPAYWLGPMLSEYFFYLSQESCSGLYFWRNSNSPLAPAGSNPSVDKTKEAKGLPLGKVYYLCLLDIYLNTKFSQLLDKPLIGCF